MTIDEDFKRALLDKNETVVSAIRNLKAEIKNAEIEKRSPLSEGEVQDVVKKKVKQHKDSIENFRVGNREDLAVREQQQMEVLLKYLPKQMEEAEVSSLVQQVIAELSAKQSDFGKVMKEVLNRAGGKTDGSVVSKLVKEQLK